MFLDVGHEGVWQSRPYRGHQLERRKRQGTRKNKGISKRSERAFPGEEEAEDSEMWTEKRTLLGGTKDALARKDCQEATTAFRRVVFALTSQMKVQARIISRTKGKFQKGKGKEEPHPQSGLFCL